MIETYEEYLERKRELREAVLKQIGPADERALRYIESISILTEEEWRTVVRGTKDSIRPTEEGEK